MYVGHRQFTSLINRLVSIFLSSLKLGVISFGGPTAHLVYFQDEYVTKQKWLSQQQYNELVALAQFLPGPTSSQVGIAIGTLRAGVLGGVISFLGFTLPSMLILICFASLLHLIDNVSNSLLQGLKLVAVAMVAHIIVTMSKTLIKTANGWLLAVFACLTTLLWDNTISQPLVIFMSMLLGVRMFKPQQLKTSVNSLPMPLSKGFALVCLSLFFAFLFLMPVINSSFSHFSFHLFEQFYRAGALVFGGGHIVLPLLEREFVYSGQMDSSLFFTGYSATQAVPGPLFTFASYLGFVMAGWKGAILATVAIFLPAFLLVFGTLPFWHTLRQYNYVNCAFQGASCAVVGILVTAFINPMLPTSITNINDGLQCIVLFLLLHRYACPPWLIVLLAPIFGYIFL